MIVWRLLPLDVPPVKTSRNVTNGCPSKEDGMAKVTIWNPPPDAIPDVPTGMKVIPFVLAWSVTLLKPLPEVLTAKLRDIFENALALKLN